METETPASFGEWIKSRRKALDLTQEELSVRAGCSVFALRKIESGERRPSKQLAALLADALQISDDDKPTFIRVARGDLALGRLRTSQPDSRLASFPIKLASHHLPLPSSPLLGRDPELASMERIFNDPQCRLLTLTGVGGIGKTRLAIEFASRQRGRFPDGVYFVPLVSANAAESIVPAVAEALKFSFSGPADLKEQLIGHMSSAMKQSALLVLDNLEHLIAQSAEAVELVSEFLERIPSLKILATSRERLNLHGEWTYELHGLPVPPVEFADRLDDYSAAVLFLQRARHIQPNFEVGEAERLEVSRICLLVEGIPLAIELAAAWVGLLTCAEIAHEIEANVDFLAASMRDLPERHRSLRASFDHSWKLLSDTERGTLSRLSIFHGGFDRAAAEEVTGASLPLLASLVSKSLVKRAEAGRYSLHEAIRQFAFSHLEEDESCCHQTCDRHCEHYLAFAANHESKLKSGLQQTAMREITAELDNLRAAWEWGIQNKKFDSLGGAVRAFGWYYEVSGMIREGIEQLELLVCALNDQPRDTHINKVLGTTFVQQGLLYFRSGQFARAQELYDQSIAILRSVDAQFLLADALIFSGTLKHLNGNYLEAKAQIAEGLAYARASHNNWFIAYGIYNLGHVDSLMGEYQKGYDQMQEGLALFRKVGDPHSISLGLNFLVDTQIALKRYDEAKESMRESIALCEQTQNRWGMGTAYRYFGLATMADGHYDQAQVCFQKSLEIFGEYFEGWDIAITFAYLADATLLAGDNAKARTLYLNSLHHARRINSAPLMLMTLAGLAQLEVHLPDVSARLDTNPAAGWLTLILNHPAATSETKDRAARLLDELRSTHTLSPPQPAWTLEQAVETLTGK
ncbi:MAG: helix-turn-helix domain-containing protein [Anaerolineae bacterium]|nr:helix-turn-helix domain-containing protein [Anaerolineae bacterium]